MYVFIPISCLNQCVNVWFDIYLLHTGCPIFYQVSFRDTFRVVPMSFETCPKLYLVVRWINFKIWDKKKVEVFCPILIRWIWDPYCEKFFNKVMTKKKFFLAIWDSISHELIRFEKKPTLVLSVPYWLGGFRKPAIAIKINFWKF